MPTWFIKSRRIWGIGITLLSTLAPVFGIGLAPEIIAGLSVAPDTIGQLIGLGITLWGSIKARGGISLTPS